MVPFNLRSGKLVFPGILIMTLFVSTIWFSSVQVNRTLALPTQQHLNSTSKPLVVKITDPIKGQQIAVGKNLTLSGIAKYNVTANCQVSVIVDSMRPYQKTIPIGQIGVSNYSQWKYALAPTYAGSIKEGINKITAKLLCNSNPTTLTKFYSINVTGVNGISPNQQHLARSNNTAAPFFLPVSSSFSSAPLNNTLAPAVIPVSVNNGTLLPPAASSTSSSSGSSDSSSSGSSSNGHHHHHSTSSANHSTSSNHHSSPSNNSGNHGDNHHHENRGGGPGNFIHSIHFRGF
ncbi:MAG: hypothetical protein M3044_07135 [Thermoproteota archaeon]|nr:hypothetical protein [Thermoproteota archaeon]